MLRPFHPASEQILERLRRERINSLHHFTCVENLPSIRQADALCSKARLEKLGLWPCPHPGGNETSHNLDKHHDNWDKLALNFTAHTPMAYWKKQAKHLCFFSISTKAAALEGVLFTDTNATSTIEPHRRLPGPDGLNLVNFNAIRATPAPGDKAGWLRPVQAEVLVPDQLSLEYVERVFFVSEESRAEGERLWGSGNHPPFVVNPTIFADFSVYQAATHNFPFLINLILTDEHVERDNVQTLHHHKSQFRRINTRTIHVLVQVQALTGAKGRIIWLPTHETSNTTFAKPSRYYHWASISIDRLPDGQCALEYWLGEVRWRTLHFEVN